MYHACTNLINRKAEALKYVVDMRESKIPRAIAWPAANGRVWKEYKVKTNLPVCSQYRSMNNHPFFWTWLKTFSLKALELYTFILTWPLQKSIHNTMIPTAFGCTTKLFYWFIVMKCTNIHSSVKSSTYNYIYPIFSTI